MKTASGMNSTLGPDSIGFGSGFKGGGMGEGEGRSVPLNAASAQVGNRFAQPSGGGLLGGIIGGPRYGYTNQQGNRVSALMDMINGGGAGMAGDTFQGGILSGLLNAIGVRPAGYRARQMQPQMSEEQVRAQMGNAPSVMAPPPVSTPSTAIAPAGVRSRYSAIRTPTLTQADIDALDLRGVAPGTTMTPQEYLALQAARTQIDYGPRAPAPMGGQQSVMQPGMNFMPDGEAFLRQDIAAVPSINSPYVDVGMSDVGTVRPGVSRAGGRIPPLQGFTPNVNTLSTPRPAGMGLGPDAGRASAVRNFVDMQRRALQAQGLLPR